MTKSRRSSEQNTSSSNVYGITHPIFSTTGLMNDNINVENNDATEDSHTLFDTDLEKEKVRREERLARTRKSLRDSSLTKSNRDKLQKRASSERWLIAQSKKNIRMRQQRR